MQFNNGFIAAFHQKIIYPIYCSPIADHASLGIETYNIARFSITGPFYRTTRNSGMYFFHESPFRFITDIVLYKLPGSDCFARIYLMVYSTGTCEKSPSKPHVLQFIADGWQTHQLHRDYAHHCQKTVSLLR